MTAFLAIALTGVGTYLMRALFILLLAEQDFPAFATRALEYVAPAVMAALVASMLVGDEGARSVGWPATIGLITAVITAATTRNHVYTLIAAMPLYWILEASGL